MRLLTIQDVHIRSLRPHRSAPAKGVIFKGFELEVGAKTVGENINGNATWYRLGEDFVWSGGFVVDPAQGNTPPPIGWSLANFDIPKLWAHTRGAGVRVAVLDTGLHLGHPDIDASKVAHRKNFLNNSIDVTDHDGHGTHCTGIIAAQGNMVAGIAPEVTLMIGKIAEGGQGIRLETLREAVTWAVENGADIVSMSVEFRRADTEAFHALETEIKRLAEHHPDVFLVAASGNGSAESISARRYPASFDECTAVGAVDECLRIARSRPNPSLHVLAPGINIRSTWKDGTLTTKNGTSQATAYMSGILALLLSHMRANARPFRKTEMLDLLRTHAKAKVRFAPGDPDAFCIVDPFALFNQLSP